jgi:hypothetical protein
MTELTLTPAQQHRSSDNMAVAMDTEVTQRPPMTALEKLKDRLRSARNLDVGFEDSNFDVEKALTLFMELDEYSQKSILPSWRGVLNMYSINQAMGILRNQDLFPDGLEKTSDNREVYDRAIEKVLEGYEQEGDFKMVLPPIIALNERVRDVMNDCMVPWRPIEDTLAFMTSTPPTAEKFIAEYDGLLARNQRPAMSKREYCDLRLATELRKHNDMIERGQEAIQFINDLNVTADRGFGDAPDWLVSKLYEKTVDKLVQARNRLNIRSMQTYLTEPQRLEAEAQQAIVEWVYEQITGKGMTSEY